MSGSTGHQRAGSPARPPWVLITDEALNDVDLGAYEMRVWIEQGFRTLKSMGWQWHRTRHLDPARVNPHRQGLAWSHWRRRVAAGADNTSKLPVAPSDAQTANSRGT